MVKKYLLSSLLISITLFGSQPPISKEDKAKKELQERAQFFKDVDGIFKQELPGLKISCHRIESSYDQSYPRYEIVLPKKTILGREHKELILHYLHKLNGGVFNFAK